MRFRILATVALLSASIVGSVGAQAPKPKPAESLGQLKAGNDRFARNASSPVSLSLNRRKDLSVAQHPSAMVLSCADSRVPPEHVFNVGLGDLFVIRSAGQVVDKSILATIEYGAEHLHIPLLVVMGHESCGAVKAAAETKGNGETPNLDYLIKAIQAAKRRPDTSENRQDRDEIKALVLDNVEQVINDTLAKSALVRRMVEGGELDVVGAYYELVSGRVVFSEPVFPAPSTSVTSAYQAAKPPASPTSH